MRRSDREITDADRIEAIMRACTAVSVAFAGETPYVIPMSFGVRREEERFTLYLHGSGAAEGEKVRRLAADERAAFAMYTGQQLITGPVACRYSTTYQSVCGSGKMQTAEGEEKITGLKAIMEQYAPGREFVFDEAALNAVQVWKIEAETISGKIRGI